jgi:hypothetical protein
MTKRNIPHNKPKPSTPTANAALAAALSIATKAHDDALEIDWSSNPATKREAALRLAMIRHVERRHAEFWKPWEDGQNDVATFTLWDLERLAPADADEIGADLYDAIERWENAAREESERNASLERRRLLDAARREIAGHPPV